MSLEPSTYPDEQTRLIRTLVDHVCERDHVHPAGAFLRVHKRRAEGLVEAGHAELVEPEAVVSPLRADRATSVETAVDPAVASAESAAPASRPRRRRPAR